MYLAQQLQKLLKVRFELLSSTDTGHPVHNPDGEAWYHAFAVQTRVNE